MKDEINPIEILKATPKNNCKKCGYDTCLAFATALVRRTTNLSKCPYLEINDILRQKINKHFSNNNVQRKPGMHALTMLEKKIKSLDLKTISANLNLMYKKKGSSEIVKIKYLDTTVNLFREKDSVYLAKENGEELDLYDKILVYNYIFFSGDEGISGVWVGIESLHNSISKVKALEKGAAKPLAKFFSGKLNLLIERAKKYPHKILPKKKCIADLCVIIYLFPMLPIRINFSDAMEEEGFEASAKFLFDKHVISYIDLESLVFASEKVTEKLITP